MFQHLRLTSLFETLRRIRYRWLMKNTILENITESEYVSKSKMKGSKQRKLSEPSQVTVAQYYKENGLRKVVPYYYTFSAFCKRRWISRRLDEVLFSEFNFDTEELMQSRIKNGSIKVNGDVVDLNYIFKDSDLLQHSIHRHELPVLDEDIRVVFEDDSLIVVNKPSSIPVHPCGQFNHNTLVKILENEKGLKNLNVIHRLDRMTSGLLLLGKTYEATLKIAKEINNRDVAKYYICEVEDKFRGPTQTDGDAPEPIIVEQPLGRLNSKMGLNMVMPESEGGKPSKTAFMRMAWKAPSIESDKGSSIVLCRLYTGRTHQVRIHVQYLGFPIIEDPLYNSFDWGDSKGAFAAYREPRADLITALATSRNRTAYLQTAIFTNSLDTDPICSLNNDFNEDVPPTKISRKADDSLSSEIFKNTRYYTNNVHKEQRAMLEAAYDPDCPDCNRSFEDPKMSNLVLRLHAYRYSGSDWSYTAPLPSWVSRYALDAGVEDLESLIENLLPRL